MEVKTPLFPSDGVPMGLHIPPSTKRRETSGDGTRRPGYVSPNLSPFLEQEGQTRTGTPETVLRNGREYIHKTYGMLG